MNEQIKELAEQATITRGGMRVVDIEKFAELIVKECAEIARSNTRVDSKLYLMIQEHFGVEE